MNAGDRLKAHAGRKNAVFRSTGNRGTSANRRTGVEISIIHSLAGILPWTRHGRDSARRELGSRQMLGGG